MCNCVGNTSLRHLHKIRKWLIIMIHFNRIVSDNKTQPIDITLILIQFSKVANKMTYQIFGHTVICLETRHCSFSFTWQFFISPSSLSSRRHLILRWIDTQPLHSTLQSRAFLMAVTCRLPLTLRAMGGTERHAVTRVSGSLLPPLEISKRVMKLLFDP